MSEVIQERTVTIEQTTKEQPKEFTPASSQKQYVSGGYYDVDVSRVLYKSSDALTLKFGDGIIAKMLRDPEISKCLTVLKISVLNEGVTFVPAVSKPAKLKPLPEGTVETEEQRKERREKEKEIKRYEKAVKYAGFATRAIENLETPIQAVLESMLDAIAYGNKVAEQTYKSEYDSTFGKTVLTLSSIRVKPRDNVRFVVDKFNKVLGFQATTYNNGISKPVILPREKFLILTFRGKDGDPRGTSILEPVYNAWYLKMQLWPEYLRWLLQCAIPSLVGYAAPEADKKAVRNKDTGELVRDEAGNVVYESDVSGLLNALVQLRNATAIALPNGAKVEPINNSVTGDPFKGMRDVLNEEIEMGIILQTLATSEGRNMSRAAAQTHMSVLDLFVFFIKGLVIDMIRNDVLKPLMKMNFENFDMSLLPKVSMGDSERRDWATDVIAVSTGWKSGFFSESQKVGLDMIINAPERDLESDRLLKEQQLANEQPKASSTRMPETREPTAFMKDIKNLLSSYESVAEEEII